MAGTTRGSGRPTEAKISGTTSKKTVEEVERELWAEESGTAAIANLPSFMRNSQTQRGNSRTPDRRQFIEQSPYVGRMGAWETTDGMGGTVVKQIDFGVFFFLSECVYTFEEVSGRVLQFRDPNTMSDEYFSVLCHVAARWQTEYLIAIPKSRRMLISWISRAMDVFYALFHPGQSIYIASLDLEKSEEMVFRCKFICDHIPVDCVPKHVMPPIEYNRARSQANRHDLLNRVTIRHSLHEPGTLDSFIQAVPASDDLRGVGSSQIDLEEFAFWKNGASMWAGLTGTQIGSGQGENKTQGRIVMVSTPSSPGHMSDIVRDRLKAS